MSMAGTAMPSALPAESPRTLAAPPVTPAPAQSALAPSLLSLAPIPVSATLAANETLARKRRAGETVLPLAFGEAGLPAHPLLRDALAAASDGNAYGPVAGLPVLREAAAGYWARRGTPTSAANVVCGPGSKALLFGLLLAIGSDVAVPQPSWVSYAAQASMIGAHAHFVPVPPGEGGVCDAGGLARAVTAAREAGRRIGSVVLTLPDNPTGRLARAASVRAVCEVAREHDLIIIADEIYRDLVHDPDQDFPSPLAFTPERTVVTTALSKSLALGGWRIGVARMPDSGTGLALRDRLVGVGSEIWSAPSLPIQQAAALAFNEPPELTQRVARSRSLHARVAVAVAARFAAAGLVVPTPQAAFYLYPDFAPWREHLRSRGVTSGAALAGHLLHRYGMGVLPASAFGEAPEVLRMRVATALLYGETPQQREAALVAGDPLALPWIAAALSRIEDVLADLAP
ncbi:MAG TPA: pyridoxal phosphate-dependent aminotransferase [Streptosporangiaceae bacterium]|nr:pyridoxal phosphate-dependent aminotransferase [Streptosporangiaceae bacterium]